MSIKSFISKFASHDLPKITEALSILSMGIGLQPDERSRLNSGIQSLAEAADRITKGLKDLSEIKVPAADVKKAVEAYVKDHLAATLADMVERGVEAALEAREKASKTPPQ